MNDRSFKIVEKNVTERRQRLNAWAGAQVGGLITMSLTLAHLIGVFLGLMSLIQPWWLLIVANGAGLWTGSLAGRRRPIRLQRDLYRLDRSYDLGEKLATIHEIRQRDDRNPYLRLLYRRISHTDLNPKRALQPSRRQRRGWAAFSGVTVASAALLALWVVGVPPLSMSSLLASGTAGDQPVVSAQSSGPDAGNSQQASSPNDADAADTSEPQTGSPCDGDGGASRTMLSRDARSDCANASSGEGSPSGNSQAASGNTRDNERMSVAELRRELQSIQQRVAAGNLSMEAAQRRLNQLAREARSPSTEELLEQASQSGSQTEMQQRMQDAMDELDRRRQRAQQSGNGRDNSTSSDDRRRSSSNADRSRQGQAEGQAPSSQEPSQSRDPQASQRDGEGQPRSQEADGPQRSESGSGPNEGESGESESSQQSESQNESAQSGEQPSSPGQQAQAESSQGENGQQASSSSQQGDSPGTGQSEGQSEGSGDSSESSERSASGNGNVEGADGGNAEGQSQGEQNGSGQSGGSAPGTGPGDDQGGTSEPTDNELANDVRIQSPNLPQDMETLESMMTRGVPFDVSGSPSADGSRQLELNPDRVETLLRSRDLPPEVRDLVRSYFLSLAEGE